MAPFNQTKRYAVHLARLCAERELLEAEAAELRAVKRGSKTPEQLARRTQIASRLKTVNKNIAGCADLSSFTWPQLFSLWAESRGCAWTEHELELNEQETKLHEGKGERALRHRFGLPLEATQDTCDLPTGEVKYVGKLIETFRVGVIGKRCYVRALKQVPDELITDEMLDGEVSAGKLYHKLPPAARERLQLELAPDKVLACYPRVYLTSDEGYSFVPKSDYASAFSLACVTQMSPKYRLRREYVESQLRLSLASATVAA